MSGRPILINFARTNYKGIARLQWAGSAAVLVLTVCAGALLWTAGSYRQQGAAADQQVRDLAASAAQLRPAMEERQQLVKNLGAMTGLIETRRHSWTRFLTSIEAAFPTGIALTKVDFRPRDQTVVLEGAAQSPEALSDLMKGLQQSRSFKNPQLKHQSMEKGSLSFNVAVSYQGQHAGPASEPDR